MIILERLEPVSDSVFITESAQDIANLLVNKPKPYRIVYDSSYDIWGIGDANLVTHDDLKFAIGDSGYLVQFPEFNTFIDNERKRIRDRYLTGAGRMRDDVVRQMLSAGEIYANSAIGGIMFYPTDYDEPEETMYYPYRIPIVSGTILTSNANELEKDYAPLYRKLSLMGAFVESEMDKMNRIWDFVKNEDGPLEKFNTLAADEGIDYDTILDFILSKIR